MSVEKKMGGEGIQKSIEALCQGVSLTDLRKVGEQRRIVQCVVEKDVSLKVLQVGRENMKLARPQLSGISYSKRFKQVI